MHTVATARTPLARAFAWTGALLFFSSLAYFLFSYIVTFGNPAYVGRVPRSGPAVSAAVTWNVILFTAFALHHSVFARDRVRAWIAQRLPAGLERAFYVWIASILFILVCLWWQPVPGVAWRAEGVMLWLLRILQVAAIWWTLRSAAVLDIRELAGLARAGEAGKARLTEFKTTGPYGWVRHPIYSGWFVLVFTASPMTMTRLTFAVVSCAYILTAIPFEERSLRALPGGTYDRYRAHVKWRLIPGIW